MPQGFHRGRRSGARWLAVAVLLAHVALLGGALRLKVWRERQPATKPLPPLVVRLLLPPLPAPVAAPRPPATLARAPGSRREPQAIALPSSVAEAPPQAAPPAPTVASAEGPASAPAAPALDLRLPRGASAPWQARNPALNDPRANSPKATMEEKLAAAMGGDGRWVMERLDGDRIRYRRGDQCVEVQRTRAGQLELANGAFRNLWGAKPC